MPWQYKTRRCYLRWSVSMPKNTSHGQNSNNLQSWSGSTREWKQRLLGERRPLMPMLEKRRRTPWLLMFDKQIVYVLNVEKRWYRIVTLWLQKLRAQENRLEKIQFKCKEAENITVNYQKVKRHLQVSTDMVYNNVADYPVSKILSSFPLLFLFFSLSIPHFSTVTTSGGEPDFPEHFGQSGGRNPEVQRGAQQDADNEHWGSDLQKGCEGDLSSCLKCGEAEGLQGHILPVSTLVF